MHNEAGNVRTGRNAQDAPIATTDLAQDQPAHHGRDELLQVAANGRRNRPPSLTVRNNKFGQAASWLDCSTLTLVVGYP